MQLRRRVNRDGLDKLRYDQYAAFFPF
jgi:hypothetical protein